ncbi:hypothetical protein Q3G72_023648 [Acer saccharum]|nr:hypothetical protein Q3G72_023648 [Acer saccharum]
MTQEILRDSTKAYVNGAHRRKSDTEKGQLLRDQGLTENNGRQDTDIILDDGYVGEDQGVQGQQVSESLVTGKGLLADKATSLGGNIEGEGQGYKGISVESSAIGCGVSSKVVEGLERNHVSGVSSFGSFRDVGVDDIQNAVVGPGKGLYKVAVALNSLILMREEAEAGSDSFSGQIPVGRAELEVGTVQINGRWKR